MRYSILRYKRIAISRIVVALLFSIFIFSETEIQNDLITSFLDNAGLILIVIGVFGRIWASLYIAGYKKTELITQGPYYRVRNPLYLFSFLAVIGVVLSSHNMIFIILALLFYMVYYPFVIMREEKRLVNRFGDRFIEYMAKTPRFFPSLNGRLTSSKSTTYRVNVDAFFKVFFDAIWFFIAYIFVDIVKMLHSKNLIPIIFKF